jgi:hypothetical protein
VLKAEAEGWSVLKCSHRGEASVRYAELTCQPWPSVFSSTTSGR